MRIENILSIPRKPADQEKIIKSLSSQSVVSMDEIVERENMETKVKVPEIRRYYFKIKNQLHVFLRLTKRAAAQLPNSISNFCSIQVAV